MERSPCDLAVNTGNQLAQADEVDEGRKEDRLIRHYVEPSCDQPGEAGFLAETVRQQYGSRPEQECRRLATECSSALRQTEVDKVRATVPRRRPTSRAGLRNYSWRRR